jgi:hypothetical protein
MRIRARTARTALGASFASVAAALAGASVCAAAGHSTQLFGGQTLGTSVSVRAYDGPGIFSFSRRGRCSEIDLSTDNSGASGCVPVAVSAAVGLSAYGMTCDAHGRFLYGLTSPRTATIRVSSLHGAPVRASLRSLPARWKTRARVWLLPVPRSVPVSALTARDRRGRPLAAYHFRAGELRCPALSTAGRGRPHPTIRWRLAFSRTRGAGEVPNLCSALEVTASNPPLREVNSTVQCTPVRLLGHDNLVNPGGEHGCDPSFAIFTGLLSPKVTAITVVLADGRRLAARVVDLARTLRMPVNAFLASTARNGDEVAYVYRTRDGRSHRARVPPAPPGCPQ